MGYPRMPAKGIVPEISELLTVTGQPESRNKKQRDPLNHVADISLICSTSKALNMPAGGLKTYSKPLSQLLSFQREMALIAPK